jgi:hypothetical protein
MRAIYKGNRGGRAMTNKTPTLAVKGGDFFSQIDRRYDTSPFPLDANFVDEYRKIVDDMLRGKLVVDEAALRLFVKFYDTSSDVGEQSIYAFVHEELLGEAGEG